MSNQISQTTRFVIMALCVIVGLAINAAGNFYLERQTYLHQNDIPAAIFYQNIKSTFFPISGFLIMLIGFAFFALPWFAQIKNAIEESSRQRSAGTPLKQELQQVIDRVSAEPEKAKPAWDLARVRLELYFDRNLSQINYIFWLSVGVMIVGFGFILFGIVQALNNTPIQVAPSGQNVMPTNSGITPAVIAGLAGIITEFIGATFLFIYRSTIQQASGYTQTLERINSVGMAMQILDTISNESKGLQDQTKAEIVKVLLSQAERISKSNHFEPNANSEPGK